MAADMAGLTIWFRHCRCGRLDLRQHWHSPLETSTLLTPDDWHCEECGGTEFFFMELTSDELDMLDAP